MSINNGTYFPPASLDELIEKFPTPSVAKTVRLIDYLDEGVPGPEHFTIGEGPVPTLTLDGDGDILIQVVAMSADPYLRVGIKPGGGKNPGDAMNGFVSGFVLASNSEKWIPGDFVGAATDFTNIQVLTKAAQAKTMIWKLTGFLDAEHLSYGVGILGMPGSTAYGGLIDVLKPNKGETLFVSAACGAVGGLVGQIAKTQYNCNVVGSCGGDEKGAIILDKFKFDHHVDYKKCDDEAALAAALKAAAPDGIDMYFENVGGMHFEVAMSALRPKGRIAVCGCIANYNNSSANADGQQTSPGGAVFNRINIGAMIYSAQRIEGFVCMPWLTGQKGNFLSDMAKWLHEGAFAVPEETHFQGIENWAAGFQSLFTGANKGKVVIMV
eukprot:CAMPEP_0194361478 /NCGR_PEP_ID=MMETSP0174-20130528/9062_1 /TAXON_ID=216777 /ORGANISM="Proboscia alata, Strain PI-D3" /LENGTH=381 /DNA_ID=CAMNT_0039133707 /DNA_START=32 /DNA_END=1177 /DNA_ORIENTATION=-